MLNIVLKTPTPVTELPRLLEARSKARAGIRMVRILASAPNHRAVTSTLCREAGVANLSAAAEKVAPHLKAMGWEIIARRPPSTILNRWNEPTGQHIWRLRRLRGGEE